jgi:hypothetical protein
MALFGLFFFPNGTSQTSKISQWIKLTTIGSILYGTTVFSITHAEYRLTIPFYPLLIISAAIAIFQLSKWVERIFS